MNNVSEITNCCGCRACEQICPVKCISFVKDAEGFLIPKVEKTKCIDCGKCLKTCAQNSYENFNEVKEVYAALHNDRKVVKDSTSGGAMTAFAEVVLQNGGVVYGTFLDTSDWKVKYAYIDDIADICKFRGSKYVQADTLQTYTEIKNFLKQGRLVLFVGTPCHVAGLYSFLSGIATDNLYTIDLLCHGTPSPELLVEHIKYSEEKYKRKLTGFSFRDKSKFPNKVAQRYEFENKKVYVLGKCDSFFQAFISGSAYRMCCYDCRYATQERVGDITLGDYWGVRRFHSKIDNSDGISLILINTAKGTELIEKANLNLVKSDMQSAMAENGILKAPSEKAACRAWFYEDIKSLGYGNALKKNVKVKSGAYNFILTHLPKSVVKFLSKL